MHFWIFATESLTLT